MPARRSAMNLKELEDRLQTLIEIDLPGILPGRKVEDLVVQKIANALHANTVETEDHMTLAPNSYTLVVHPSEVTKWENEQLLTVLLHSISTVAQEAGFRFIIAPTILISTSETISLNDAEVQASHRVESMEDTNATPLDAGNAEEDGSMPENAFLIVEGVKVYPLGTPVVNIGRRLENQLIIDDPR